VNICDIFPMQISYDGMRLLNVSTSALSHGLSSYLPVIFIQRIVSKQKGRRHPTDGGVFVSVGGKFSFEGLLACFQRSMA